MNSERLYQLLQDTTQVYRKGAEVETRQFENVKTVEVFGYPHSSEVLQDKGYDKVDMVFVDVVVDKQVAMQRKSELESLLSEYPDPERLAGGPSYVELAPSIGLEQEGALRLMALGKTLGLWDVMSGKTLGLNEQQTRELAGSGMLMITGYSGGEK